MNILNKLTIKHLRLNKKRTLVTILGIVLSTALMVGIGCLVATARDFSLQQIQDNNGSHHVLIEKVAGKDYKYISKNVEVDEIKTILPQGYSILNSSENIYKPYLYVISANSNYLNSLKLTEGRMPKKSDEIVIPSHVLENGGVKYKLGEKISLEIGSRYQSGELLNQANLYSESETFKAETKKTFTIVGFIKRDILENYSSPGYQVYTYLEDTKIEQTSSLTTYITYKKVKDIHNKTDKIIDNLSNKDAINTDYNDTLLSFYGESSYESINNTLVQVLGVVLTILMLGCAVVIYNSFAISVMERKKQFGLFSSIGATKKQIYKTVFFEAIIVGGLGLIIGTIGGILGVWTLLQVTNALLPEVFEITLRLSLYPIFIVIPIIYMIVTIFISAFLPARSAAKISPIEAIRLNDDIKMKKKKIKTFKWVRKVFGIEGELALKNMKRSKKKYRITIISLVVSIVLFISFSSFYNYGNNLTDSYLELEDSDISGGYYSNAIGEEDQFKKVEELFHKIKNIDKIDDCALTYTNSLLSVDKYSNMTKDFENYLYQMRNHEKNTPLGIIVIAFEEKEYREYLKELGLSYNDFKGSELKPILINKTYIRDYTKQTINETSYFNNNKTQTLDFVYDFSSDESKQVNTKVKTILVEKPPKLFKNILNSSAPAVIISKSMYDELTKKIINESTEALSISLNIKSKEHKKVYEEIEKLIKDYGFSNRIYFSDISSEMELQNNLKLVVGIFLYGFIALVTLIGVTSVFNTINTSMALRSKEFAVLKSIGLTNKGINKMLRFESIFYGFKALLYGIPLSIGVIFLIHSSFNEMYKTELMLPVGPILIAVVAVFLITFATMSYATRKIKKENIIDTIREENI